MAVPICTWARLPIVAGLGAALFLLAPSILNAGPLLLSSMDRPFGPGSGGLAGGQVALVGGSDAAWSNPAGLAREPRSEIYLDTGSLEIGQVTVGSHGDTTLGGSPGAAGWVSGPNRARPRLAYAILLHFPAWQSSDVRLAEKESIDGAALPASVAGGLDYAALFPSGIRRNEDGSSSGNLTIFSPGFAVGWRLADGLRIGGLFRLERVSLRVRESFSQNYAAEDDSSSDNVLSGSTQSAADFSGDVNRYVLSAGLQYQLGKRLVFGAVWKLPSVTLGGTGQVLVNRSDSLEVTQNGTPLQQASATARIDAGSTAFDLRSAGSIRVGLGLFLEGLAIEFDLEQVQALPRYKVFPDLESGPPSTAAYRLGAMQTQSNAVTRYSISAAIPLSSEDSWLIGFATDPAAVPASDRIFRKADLFRFTTGYYATREEFAGSIRLGYTTVEAPSARFQHVSDSGAIDQPVRSATWSLGVSGSYVF